MTNDDLIRKEELIILIWFWSKENDIVGRFDIEN